LTVIYYPAVLLAGVHLSSTSDQSTAERLISVAGEIFAHKGLTATVREICTAAGCSVAAINYYFGDKQRLYVRCVEAACERKQRLFPVPQVEVLGCEPGGAGEAGWHRRAELLREFLMAVAQRVGSEANLPWQNTLVLREILTPSAQVFERLAEYFQPDFQRLDRLLGEVLGRDLDSPELRRSLATQILARIMFLRTGKNLRAMLGLNTPQNEVPEQVAAEICDSILHQIQALRARLHDRSAP
jgi:TetR/AcrR family transcriptional regulator, regulator of cefoperazone and chloramphenicol sensitivity